MPRLISIDPGKATGIAYGYYDDETEYRLQDVLITHDGVDGVAELYWNSEFLRDSMEEIVVENYIMGHGPQDPVALEVIGFIKGVHQSPFLTLQKRSDKRLVPDKLLKDHGFWQTGKTVGHTDGRDANDAIIHGIAYLFKKRHLPTMLRYFND
jgi:hypothetical protein